MNANLLIEVYNYIRDVLADAAAQAYLLARGEMSPDELNSFYTLFALIFVGMVWAVYQHRGRVRIAAIIARARAFEEVAMRQHNIHNYGYACLGITVTAILVVFAIAMLLLSSST